MKNSNLKPTSVLHCFTLEAMHNDKRFVIANWWRYKNFWNVRIFNIMLETFCLVSSDIDAKPGCPPLQPVCLYMFNVPQVPLIPW